MRKKSLLSLIIFFSLGLSCQVALAAEKTVQLLVASWCVRCKDMEELLKQQKVIYQRYDVETDQKGRELYGSLGGGGVPILIAGNKLIRGYDRLQVLEMIDSMNKQLNYINQQTGTTGLLPGIK